MRLPVKTMKNAFYISLAVLASLLCAAYEGKAQSEEGETAPAEQQKPVVIEQPAYEYFYWPDEDLNNFGLSSMGGGKRGTTMGSESERKSNIEVNASLKSRKEKASDSEEAPQPGAAVEETGNPEPYESTSEVRPPASKSRMYEWVDDKGVTHFTNNIGDVPVEYQQQYLEESAD